MTMLARYAATGSGGDPYYQYVSLLLPCNGANGSTTFTDYSPSPKTVTANGQAQISTAQSVFGGGSGVFDGNGDYLSAAFNSGFNFGSNDFTVELWFRPTVLTAGTSPRIINIGTYSANDYFIIDYVVSSNTIRVIMGTSGGSTTTVISYTGIPVTGAWTYIAVVRSGSTVTLYLGGTAVATGTAVNTGTDGALWIGGISWASTTTYNITGYIDDLRITKGIARYTGSTCPVPTQPFPTY